MTFTLGRPSVKLEIPNDEHIGMSEISALLHNSKREREREREHFHFFDEKIGKKKLYSRFPRPPKRKKKIVFVLIPKCVGIKGFNSPPT